MSAEDRAQELEIKVWEAHNSRGSSPVRFEPHHEGYGPEECDECGAEMHPVRRGYVDDPLHWRYSSARNYAGLAGLIPVQTDWGL